MMVIINASNEEEKSGPCFYNTQGRKEQPTILLLLLLPVFAAVIFLVLINILGIAWTIVCNLVETGFAAIRDLYGSDTPFEGKLPCAPQSLQCFFCP